MNVQCQCNICGWIGPIENGHDCDAQVKQTIESLRAQLAEAQRNITKLREFVAAFDAYQKWNQGYGDADDSGPYETMLEKRAALGE